MNDKSSTGRRTSLVSDYHLLSYREVDSTNEEAKRLAEGGASHGAFIWARKQLSGRGRMGRRWISEEGNLFISVLLSPDEGRVSLSKMSELPFVAALSVFEMLRAIVDDKCTLEIKWANDILLDGKKVAGILVESFTTKDDCGVERSWAVVGVGVNIDSYPLSDDVSYPATCLTATGVQIISAKIVLSHFIHHFIERYDSWMEEGFSPVIEEWRKHAFRLGKPVTVVSGNEEISGIFEDIASDGSMIIRESGGKKHHIVAGDVTFSMDALY